MKIYLVGGAVRDKLLGWPVKERDWVVVGATVDEMLALGYLQVGKEFPVFLHPKTNEEYALARVERKTKPGYKGFSFDTATNVSLEEDLKRRDLTINAMAETAGGELIDPYQGHKDLQQKMLRHVSSAFAEDPVRILRVARFLARYAHLGFHIADETIRLMKQMVIAGEVNALVAERVWKELERALGEKQPQKFFETLAECGALAILFPHLQISGPGMNALEFATQLTTDPAIRFAALCYAQPEGMTHPDAAIVKKTINTLCKNYRVPNAYQELALLTALHHEQILKSKNLSAEQLLNLFNLMDVYRREERFKQVLVACVAIAQSLKTKFEPDWLIVGVNEVKKVDIQAILAQGCTGQELVDKIKEKRLVQITSWLKQKK